MRILISICLVFAVVSSFAADEKVKLRRDGKTAELTLEMQVVDIALLPNDALTIVAKGKSSKGVVGLVVEIPSGQTKVDNTTSSVGQQLYRFPVWLKPSEVGGETLDKLVSGYFEQGKAPSFFRSYDYSGISNLLPKNIAKKGGQLFLTDAGEGGWDASIQLDVEKGTLSLSVKRLSF